MEIRKNGKTLFLDDRHLSELDLFVCRALDVISDFSPYVIVSGYVAILFGRTRSTEDVDILIPFCDDSTFLALHTALLKAEYEFLNAEDASGLYSLLVSGSGIRLCERGLFIPNIEIKFVKNDADEYSFQNRVDLHVAENVFCISPLEIQIAYKLWLGSEKDIEDAIFIYEISQDFIDEDLYREFCSSFGVSYEPS